MLDPESTPVQTVAKTVAKPSEFATTSEVENEVNNSYTIESSSQVIDDKEVAPHTNKKLGHKLKYP